jgi:hypothetical protein
MLIVIGQELHNKIPNLVNDSVFIDCIDNLTIAHRKGSHLVSGSPLALRSLATHLANRSECASTLRSILSRYHEQASIIAAVAEHIVLSDSKFGSVTRATTNGHTTYTVPFSYFSKFTSTSPSSLVAEDSTDKEIYISVLKAFKHSSPSLKSFSLNIYGVGGGGANMCDHFAERAEAGPTFAIVDSDRKYPGDGLGSTAISLSRKANDIALNTVSDIEILNCHELENIIPAALLQRCAIKDDGATFISGIDNLCKKLRDHHINVKHFDFKIGVRGWDLLSRSESDINLCRHLASSIQSMGISAVCPLSCANRASCTCIHIVGIGSGYLARIAREVNSLTPQKTAEYFFSSSSNVRDIWEQLCRRLFSWACAAPPMRV